MECSEICLCNRETEVRRAETERQSLLYHVPLYGNTVVDTLFNGLFQILESGRHCRDGGEMLTKQWAGFLNGTCPLSSPFCSLSWWSLSYDVLNSWVWGRRRNLQNKQSALLLKKISMFTCILYTINLSFLKFGKEKSFYDPWETNRSFCPVLFKPSLCFLKS